MARKQKEVQASAPEPAISRRGWKIVGAGVAFLVVGYVVLCFTDPRGQNWASVLSPFLILGGYAIIGAGILQPDPPPAAS
jgi:hypothetical protein